MDVTDVGGLHALGLSDEQINRLRAKMQSTVVETVRGPKADTVVLGRRKTQSIDVPKFKAKDKAIK